MAAITTKNIVAGDTIYVATPGSWGTRFKTWTVNRVTAGGQVIVKYGKDDEYEIRFDKGGVEMKAGVNLYRRSYLVDKATYDESVANEARRRAESDIRAEIDATKNVPMSELVEALRKIQTMIADLDA